ncbi:MAG TPA: hypothetical protein VFS60_18845, partial [Thermoanaerobaculia bacterium]|nr:hypothetical protein [Thermoanaerobaculia bacterium]
PLRKWPCSWEEVERGEVGAQSFTLRSMAERLDAVGDLWAELAASGQSVREASERLKRVQRPKRTRGRTG